MPEDLRRSYQERQELLQSVATGLESETRDALGGLPHIDRISFRVKGADSFVHKATDPSNNPPYNRPLEEIEDQVAGRIIVFFVSDMDGIRQRILSTFNPIERSMRRPARDAEFGYESEHLICLIPPHVKPQGWEQLEDKPTTFELQIRTIFMHAYAEPQHDIAYKSATDLTAMTRRELAWIAASAWGADRTYSHIIRSLQRESARAAPEDI